MLQQIVDKDLAMAANDANKYNLKSKPFDFNSQFGGVSTVNSQTPNVNLSSPAPMEALQLEVPALSMDWGSNPDGFSLAPSGYDALPGQMDFSKSIIPTGENQKYGVFKQTPGGEGGSGPPEDVAPNWLDKGKFGLGVAKVGLDAYNAYQQAKVNDFMKSYYGRQMDLAESDYANNARSANEALAAKQRVAMSARGIDPRSEEGQESLASYMDKWGADETV